MALSKMVPPLILGVVLVVIVAAPAPNRALAVSLAKPGCPDRCGNLSIPYPFGVSSSCYHDEDFLITCNYSSSSGTHEAFLRKGNISVSNILLNEGQLEVMQSIASDCYNSSGWYSGVQPKISFLKFWISTMNKFTAIGCDTYAYYNGSHGEGKRAFGSGCVSICDGPDYISNGSCSGLGCCQTSIPKGVRSFSVSLASYDNHTGITEFNPCSYAFVIQEGKFNFSLSNFTDLQKVKKLPLVLDWGIGDLTCDKARKSSETTYACTDHSDCVDVENGSGYRCNCSKGYEGNPYLPNGCQDIDECKNPDLSLCEKQARCDNTNGSYTCSCPKGYHGDGKKDGEGCTRDQLPVILIAICTPAGITVIFLGISWLYFGVKKRKLIRLKEKFFQENGGIMLQQKLSSHHGTNDAARVFSAEELKRATNNYDESRIIGKGGFGTVYKGILTDERIVAIKKSKVVNHDQVEQFINEVVVLSQINLRNVVKLLGCCLETQVPLLVYEFISNGTLYDHIHNQIKATLLSWEVRVKIAAETAGVLSYLHSAASTPIIHRDIKPTNILLDDNYTAKVSDFGASRLVPMDQKELSTMVQGTLGYMDPEYFHTSQLTEKSDVYSFGVVLVELLAGKKALCFERPEKERNLAMYFLSSMKENQLFHVVDDRIVLEESSREQIMDVAKLAMRCLRVKGAERPSMKEVAMELEGIMRSMMEKHPWENIDLNVEESKYLLDENSSDYGHGSNSQSMAGYDSMRQQIVLPLGSGR